VHLQHLSAAKKLPGRKTEQGFERGDERRRRVIPAIEGGACHAVTLLQRIERSQQSRSLAPASETQPGFTLEQAHERLFRHVQAL
jgi:hypothetical protein